MGEGDPPPVGRREEDGPTVGEVEGFTDRMDDRLTVFMRRMWRVAALAFVLVVGGVVINVVLLIDERGDDELTAKLVQDNREFIDRLAVVAEDAQKRGADTDRRQCSDIEELKAVGREGTVQAIERIQASDLSPRDKIGFIEDARTQLSRLRPLSVTVDGRERLGVAACDALPNATPAKP